MKTIIILLFLGIHPMLYAINHCDLKRFRWECDLPMHTTPSSSHPSVIYCGDTHGYVSKAHYDILTNYHRRSVNMVLKINGMYIDSPCIPGER